MHHDLDAASVDAAVGMPDGGPNAREWNSLMEHRVLAIEECGNAHMIIRAALVGLDVSDADAESAVLGSRKATYLLVDELGNILMTSSDTPATACILPELPLAVGGQWSTPSQFPLPSGELLPVTLHYRFVALQQFQGRRCAHLEMQAEARGVSVAVPRSRETRKMDITARSTILFDHENGILVSAEAHTAMTAHMEMKRVATRTTTRQELLRVEL